MAIQVLRPEVIGQIAAGEVIERPAHLVKELVENALDAQATEIEIDFRLGGRSLRVSDNGFGINEFDLGLALTRHATSKISNYEDLFRLTSYGFRGEALASACHVSRLALVSRQPSRQVGFRIRADFGVLGPVDELASLPGTLITIDDLFQNVPARLKFLKSDASEAAQIHQVVKALALTQSQVTFRLKGDGKLIHYWPATESQLTRAQQVLEVAPLYTSSASSGPLKAIIHFASPAMAAKSARKLWLFANGRWIQDKTLLAAVQDAFRGLLMHGEFAVAVVQVECEPAEVDVNIHPTKSQVKFRDSASVFRLVNKTLRSALERAPWLETLAPIGQPAPQTEPTTSAGAPVPWSRPAPYQGPSLFEARLASPAAPQPEPFRWSELNLIGQAHLTYLIAQTDKLILFIDQHAAHERVLYERLMRDWQQRRPECQNFLVPLELAVGEDEGICLAASLTELAHLGFALEQMSPQRFYVLAAPALATDKAVLATLSQFVAEQMERTGGDNGREAGFEGISFAVESQRAKLAASLACHSAVRAGQALRPEQMRELLLQMEEFSFSSFCPHGRPVYVELARSRLERDFGRIV